MKSVIFRLYVIVLVLLFPLFARAEILDSMLDSLNNVATNTYRFFVFKPEQVNIAPLEETLQEMAVHRKKRVKNNQSVLARISEETILATKKYSRELITQYPPSSHTLILLGAQNMLLSGTLASLLHEDEYEQYRLCSN